MHGPLTANTPRISIQGYTPAKRFIAILVNGVKVHDVVDANEFYERLGYTREHSHAGLMPEEFIWAEYTSANSRKPKADLDARILMYLSERSPVFLEKFGAQYRDWLAALQQA